MRWPGFSRPAADGDPEKGIRATTGELIGLRHRAAALGLNARARSVSALAGSHHSRFRGRGLDYQESRPYQPGDDIRHMDWRVLARSDRPHTKLYREEREKPVIVMVDFNPSMFFGTRVAFKSVIAARAAALIGWAAIGNGDRAGAFLFGAGRHHELPPAGGRRGALRLIHALAEWSHPALEKKAFNETSNESNLSDALQRLQRVARPGSLIVILSDFYALDASAERHLSRLRRHNDLIACRVLDPLEAAAPPPGRYGITDGERSAVLETFSPQLRAAYRRRFEAFEDHLSRLTRRCGVALIQLRTDADPLQTLRRGLAGP